MILRFNRRQVLGIISASSVALFQISNAQSQTRSKKVRVIVALADNENQEIVPIKPSLGNGQSPRTNLYWGALYGVKTYFRRHKNWQYEPLSDSSNPYVLERVRFERVSKPGEPLTILEAEAWDGANIRDAVKAFYAELNDTTSTYDLVVFVGHNTLMEMTVMPPIATDAITKDNKRKQRAAMVLACNSERFFKTPLENLGVTPLVMTRGMMAPEAYSLEAAIEAWRKGESANEVRGEAARLYADYQKIPLRNAKRLFGVR